MMMDGLLMKNRNTPTSVGKTSAMVLFLILARKHPHERGEDESCARR